MVRTFSIRILFASSWRKSFSIFLTSGLRKTSCETQKRNLKLLSVASVSPVYPSVHPSVHPSINQQTANLVK